MNVKIRNKFIEIKYRVSNGLIIFSVSNGLVIFITNYWWFRILEISRYRRSNGSVFKILGKSINSIPLFMKGIFMKCC